MRRPLLIGNWKMNTNLARALDLARISITAADRAQSALDVGICPPFPWIAPVAELASGSSLHIGAQDISPEPDGAFTGDVSATMLSAYCQFVIVGHSERRTVHGESDSIIARKVRRAREHEMGVVLCVGETTDQRASGHATSIVIRQLERALDGLSGIEAGNIAVAYEPVWAIGSGEAATVVDAQEMSSAIRGLLQTHPGFDADRVRILYGGSVSDRNVREFLPAPDIDGALIGSASLDPQTFSALVDHAMTAA